MLIQDEKSRDERSRVVLRIEGEGGMHDKERDFAEAFEYYTKAIKLGELGAANLYRLGYGFERDQEKRHCTLWKRQP